MLLAEPLPKRMRAWQIKGTGFERFGRAGAPDEIPPVQAEVQTVIDAAEGKPWPMISIERYAFYERAKSAYCVIQSGERRFYGCFAFRKGVIPPDAD